MKRWWFALLACSASTAWAQDPTLAPAPDAGAMLEPAQLSSLLDSAVSRLAAAARADAQRWLDQQRYPEALAALQTARELEPHDLEVALRLAELELKLGHADRAERLYRELLALAPDRGDVYVALADLVARDRQRPERLHEAAELYAKAQERLGDDASLRLRKARLAAARGSFDEAEQLYREVARAGPDDALELELGDFYRDAGRTDDALAFYREVAGPLANTAAQRIFELEVDKEARRYGFSRADRSVDPQLRALRQRARLAVAQRQLAAAEAALREALGRAPERAELHAELADVLVAAGQSAAAELEFLRAIALDGSQPEVYLRLAELYLASDSPRAAEAAWLLERSLSVRPDWSRPQLLLARAYQAQGDLPRALAHVTRFVAQAAPGSERDEAVALQASLQAAVGEAQPGTGLPSTAAIGGDSASRSGADHLARARTFLGSGQTDAALAELRHLEGSAVLGDQAIDLQARVLYAAGRLSEATALLAATLARQPAQAELRELLGEVWLARRAPDRARSQWLQCEAARAACGYRLARLERPRAGVWETVADLSRAKRLWEARSRLARLPGQPDLPVAAPELARLRSEIDVRLGSLAALATSSCLLAFGLVLAVRRARWGGLDLAELLARHPQASPEVQRVLSAIRHEVLKHNTLMLEGVARGLREPTGGAEAAAHIARALVGVDGRGGAAARLDDYADNLVQIARAYGERLNLQRRDPALAAFRHGFALVRHARLSLAAVDRLRPRARRKLAERLQRASHLLNERGQSELRSLLDGMRNLRLTPQLLAALFDRVRNEPALSGAPIEPLVLDPSSELPCSVAVPAQAFDDILANLFRNALQASLRYPEPRPVMVGLLVQRHLDDVTGLATAELRVRDRAPERLDPDKLRGGYIEAGLGLTADLVARHDGQLSVHAPEPGYGKAVVLRLPVQRSEAP